MSTSNGRPRVLEGCAVLPALDDSPSASSREPKPAKTGKAKGKTAGERFKILNAFIDFTLADLTRTEIAAWLVLYRDTKEGTARTAMTDIARRAGCSVRQVVRAVQRLEALGLVRVVHRGGFRRGASRYRVQSLTREV